MKQVSGAACTACGRPMTPPRPGVLWTSASPTFLQCTRSLLTTLGAHLLSTIVCGLTSIHRRRHRCPRFSGLSPPARPAAVSSKGQQHHSESSFVPPQRHIPSTRLRPRSPSTIMITIGVVRVSRVFSSLFLLETTTDARVYSIWRRSRHYDSGGNKLRDG